MAAMGGRERLEKLSSYEMTGSAELMIRGSSAEFQYGVYRRLPDKYSEIMSSDSAGEIREVYNSKSYFTQADYGFAREGLMTRDTADIDLLSPITSLLRADSYTSLKFAGTYERDGRKVALIDATSKQGSSVALAFDVETKMLSYFTGPYFGMIFGDYRKTGDLMMPHNIEREGIMRIRFDDIKINTVIDEIRFSKKINCFDIPN